MSSIGGIGSWQQTYQPYTPPTFSQLDTDSSGGISLDEFEAGAPKAQSGSDTTQSAAKQKRAEALFSKIDTNGDGSISSSELDTFQSQIADQRQSQQFATQLLASGQQPQSDADTFSATDTNGDGSVSLAEFSKNAQADGLTTDQTSQIFNAIDTNADGSISSTESSAFLDKLRSEVASTGASGSANGTTTTADASGAPPPGGPPPGGVSHCSWRRPSPTTAALRAVTAPPLR